ncbi:MAG: glucoamylase family protein [Candidatus Eiseniibacteriota bacterium]|jgi:hypothetical protein
MQQMIETTVRRENRRQVRGAMASPIRMPSLARPGRRRPAPVTRRAAVFGGAIAVAVLAIVAGASGAAPGGERPPTVAWDAGRGGGFAGITQEALLDSLERTAFDFFWYEANPANGLIRDRSTPWSPCSIASVGFGLTAIHIGIDRGWVSREEGRERVRTTLETFWTGPQGSGATGTIGYKGFFYHFLDMDTATRVWDSELSSIDTALLLAGVIDARRYFTTEDPLDVEVRALADSIVQRVDWEFMRNSGVGLRMGWVPGTGFSGFGTWVGYNEAMIMYLLALGSPTHPIPASTWFTWTSGYDWETQYGYEYVVFPPLFGHQYSHCWIDFRDIQDGFMRSRGIDYFENSRRATLAQQAYCIDNPGGFIGYGDSVWGITAGDGPFGYMARGAPPAQNDDGTITPTAVAGSAPFAPEIVLPTLQHLYDTYGPQLWSIYGFKDGFNLTQNWWATDYIGIDQGPIILMIENYRAQSVWERFMLDPVVQAGLERAGFTPVVGVPGEASLSPARVVLSPTAPSPFRGSATIRYRLPAAGRVTLRLYDVQGRAIRQLVDAFQSAGEHRVELQAAGLANGVYYYRLESNGQRLARTCILVE